MSVLLASENNGFWLSILFAFIIYLGIPAAGVWIYLQLIKRMNEREVPKPPSIELLVVFANYGALLLLVLTTFFLPWSGMASLASFYLILLAPVLMAIMAWRLWRPKDLSSFHYNTFIACIAYFVIAPATFIILYRIVAQLEEF